MLWIQNLDVDQFFWTRNSVSKIVKKNILNFDQFKEILSTYLDLFPLNGIQQIRKKNRQKMPKAKK